MYSHDVIIAGCGTAGLSLANLLIDKGVDIGLIDIRSRDKIGDKICGDAIAGHHFIETNIPRPEPPSVRNIVEGIILYGESLEHGLKVTSRHGGYVVDRHRYGQQLLSRLLGGGVKLYDRYKAVDLILDNGSAVGVKCINLRDGGIVRIHGRIVVDATGYTASLLSRAPDQWGIEKAIESRDKIIGYREIIEVKKAIWEIDNLILHFHSRYAPGGYVWLFPWSRDGLMLNYGNGIIAGMGLPSPKYLVERYAHEVLPDILVGRRVIKSGQWVIPNRRPRHVFVGDGFIAVGDSAIMIDPATAEGIGYGMYGAYIASGVIVEAIEAGDYSREMLWRYQKGYMSSQYGVRQARLDVFRLMLQAHSGRDIDFVIRNGILTSDEISRARDEDEVINIFTKIFRASKAILLGRYDIIRSLGYALKMMKRVRRLYEEYPDRPEGISEWVRREEALFREVKNYYRVYIPKGL